MNNKPKLLIVGNPELIHVGAHLRQAAQSLNLLAEFCDSRNAYQAHWLKAKINWNLRGHLPSRLEEFSQHVVGVCERFMPQVLITTGINPLAAWALSKIGEMGIRRLNFLTDDPWNPAHRADWFFEALPLYDHIFSPRRSNLPDLQQLGCRQVSWLPFAYAPELHYPEKTLSENDEPPYAADVIFAGGADADRVSYFAKLLEAGFEVALYGGYWDRFSSTRAAWRGYADPPTLRKVIGAAKVALCLVRRDNRDGHAMRTFEVPAIGACMLVEDTAEHREIFGADEQAVVFFSTAREMVEKMHWLLSNQAERQRLALRAHNIIVQDKNTYADRLRQMLAA